MQMIEVETRVAAPAVRVFLLSLSVELHTESTKDSDERAVGGVTSGLLKMGDTVEWRARHFGLPLTHEVQITAYDAPRYFQDTMTRGLFKDFQHDHFFTEEDRVTVMRDVLRFSAPFGLLGRVVEVVELRRHLAELLRKRNAAIRLIAESERWREFLPV